MQRNRGTNEGYVIFLKNAAIWKSLQSALCQEIGTKVIKNKEIALNK